MGRLDEYDFESELDKKVVSMYFSEMYVHNIINKLPIHGKIFYNILDKYNIPRRLERSKMIYDLTNTEIEKFKEMYLNKKSFEEIREEFGITTHVIYDLIKEYDLPKWTNLTDTETAETRKKVQELFLNTRLTGVEIQKKTGVTRTKYLNAIEELPPEKVTFRKEFYGLSKKELKEIRYLYYAGGSVVTTTVIEKEYDISNTLLISIRDKLNLPPQTELRVDWIIKMKRQDKLSVSEISEKMNMSSRHINKVLRDNKNTKIRYPSLIIGLEKFDYGDELIQQIINKEHVTGGGIMNKENVIEEDTVKKEIEDKYLKEYKNIAEIVKSVKKPYDDVKEIIDNIPKYKKEYRSKYRGLQPEELKKLIYWHYGKHVLLSGLEEKYSYSAETLRNILRELNLPSQTDFNIEKVKKLTLEGWSLFEITKEVRFREMTVMKYMRETTEGYTPKYVDLMEQVTDIDNIKVPMPTPEGGEKMVAPDPEPEEVDEIKEVKEDLTPEKKFFGDELLITGDFTIRTSVSEDKYSGSLKIIIE